MNVLKIKHIFTGYHYRKRDNTKIAICSCGWRCWQFRKIHYLTNIRSVVCLLRGHRWGEEEESHMGPTGFEESADTLLSIDKQCDFCWKVEKI